MCPMILTIAHRLGPKSCERSSAYNDALLGYTSGMTKAEIAMIVVATPGENHCQYCVVAHGDILRIRAKKPLLFEQAAVYFRQADLTER